jgi:hypothetical protein
MVVAWIWLRPRLQRAKHELWSGSEDGVAVLREAVQGVKGCAGMAQVIVTIKAKAEHAERQPAPTTKAV